MSAEVPRGASPEAIKRHYDLPPSFYALFLDPELTYSSAYYEPGDTLARAQERKLDYHLTAARAAAAERLLDVGCGWGSLMRRAITHHGVRTCTGLTLSDAQADVIRAKGPRENEVRLESWVDYKPAAPFDAVISVGAFEHFAKLTATPRERVDAYRMFFRRCAGWLRPGGYLSLQTIGIGDAVPDRQAISDGSFIAEHIFQESALPRASEILQASERVLELVGIRNDREHYAQTCTAWLEALLARRAEAVDIVGDETVDVFARYLQAATRMMTRGDTTLLRLVFRRLGR